MAAAGLQLRPTGRRGPGLHLAVGLAALAAAGCGAERLVAREVLADPLMRFEPGRPVRAPSAPPDPDLRPLPTDTARLRVRAAAEPGAQADGLWIDSEARAAVELAAGFGLEAGYSQRLERRRVFRFDGFHGRLQLERLAHGPVAALVYDDGTSVLRAGYRYRTAFDGDSHAPVISARTLVLGSDTVVELAYRRTMQRLRLAAGQGPALEAVAADRTSDHVLAAVEQGFLPGINLRLELAGAFEEGYLQSPYRWVTLWSHWPATDGPAPATAPRARPEQHPPARMRWGALLRARFAIPAWSAAAELGAGWGTGSWRVEHSQAQLGWLQRLGRQLTLELHGGAAHRIRASFYRDDYPDGPPGAHWTADRSLAACLSWWARIGLRLSLLPERGRLLGFLRHLELRLVARLLREDFNFEGLAGDNGFTRYAAPGAAGGRQAYAGGWHYGGWLGLTAGF